MKILSIFIPAFILFGGVSDKVKQKANKAITRYFETDSFTKKIILLDDISELQSDEKENKVVMHIFDNDSKSLGYAVLSKGKGRFDYFDFIVIYNNNLDVKKVKVLEYTSSRGAEICSYNWLKQFVDNKQFHDYGKNIDALSGATMSAESIVNEINLINKIMLTLKSTDSLK